MIYENVQTLIDYGKRNGLIAEEDSYVVRNCIMEALKLTDWQECRGNAEENDIDSILKPIIDYAVENGIISDTANSRDLFDTKIMGIFTPMPREVNKNFYDRLSHCPEEATDWYYDFSKKLNYVRAGRIAKDLKWTYDCEYGTLDITINCSKPEKDPRDIAAAKLAKAASYPKCQLCAENAGFPGTATHPARQNLRPVNITVNNEKWQLQYSPYGYYNEHCIVFNTEHIPMKIDETVFGKLFDIIDFLPHYFVGSNADLPIVGGSILSHEHFQGGRYTFAMEKAPVEREFTIDIYPDVKAGTVKWPMSVIRLSSTNRDQLSKCCNHVLVNWRGYSDPDAVIFAETDGTPHNTITPIARKRGEMFECDLVLRNNYTTPERPLGLYHPNPELHHIKKENIGLIEVMGLAVLPARLSKELVTLEKAMVNNEELEKYPELIQHAPWAKKVLEKHPEFSKDNAKSILEQEVGEVFMKVLLDAGVYKRDENGVNAFKRFTDSLNG
ncbi:MAG: UDP-glucose--hexose-1-phosphate uridylyltransferase [Ruminococcaceae bacterium]|nr:UDP-glucose--hexose-1-phosphate uridylyltransferase [Oscillospiraceae bacterium]